MAPRAIRILLIEPEPHVARSLERALKRAGEVTVASAASYALEWLAAGERYDVILCAVMMRHLTGPEFYRRACYIDGAIGRRVVFLSGGMQRAEERAVRSLPNLVLDKPVSLERLLGVVALIAEECSGTRH